jgi:hypothetical protein
MSTLKWNRPKDQTFEAGLDRGVLYLEPDERFINGRAVAWSGLINVEDSGSSDTKELYRDGQKYLSVMSGRDWEGSLEAYTYPEEFDQLIGIKELGDGLFADSQIPGRFGLSYRTMVSSPNLNDEQHYKIHLIYKVMASIDTRTYSTLSSSNLDPSTFSFSLSAVPQKVPGSRPTAHIILDTRKIDVETRQTLEEILYGKFGAEPHLPTITELVDLLSFGDTVTIVENFYTSPEPLPILTNPKTNLPYAYGDIKSVVGGVTTFYTRPEPLPSRQYGESKGTWTATGAAKNVRMTENPFTVRENEPNWDFNTYFELNNVNARQIYDSWNPGDLSKSEVYEFFESTMGLKLYSDTDGVPYYADGEEPSNTGIDTDGAPYYGEGENDASINRDTDGSPYYTPR